MNILYEEKVSVRSIETDKLQVFSLSLFPHLCLDDSRHTWSQFITI